MQIYADREKVKRVLVNLLDNSVKYNQENSEVKLQLGWSDTRDSVFIDLFNTGCGLSVEESKRVVEQFYRLEKSRSTAFGGGGLDLTITQKIVELHGGTTPLTANPAVGCHFMAFCLRGHLELCLQSLEFPGEERLGRYDLR